MTRVSAAQLDERAVSVSAMLHGDLRVVVQGRNGGTALDLYDATGCIRMLTAGTKREVADYLGAMIETLSIVGREAS